MMIYLEYSAKVVKLNMAYTSIAWGGWEADAGEGWWREEDSGWHYHHQRGKLVGKPSKWNSLCRNQARLEEDFRGLIV